MTSLDKALRDFAQFAAKLRGDEKSEAQTFLFHLLEAFGHDSNTLPEGSTFEYRVRSGSPPPESRSGVSAERRQCSSPQSPALCRDAATPKGGRTKYADFVWPGRVLIEMKSRGVKLSKHYQQTFDYWLNLVPHRPPYVVLCNFDEFWIYDFNTQLNEPVDRLRAAELPERHAALNFLFPRPHAPLFAHNWVHVTREAARDVAHAFNSLVARGEDRVRARRFILQCVVAMFAEDIGLLPRDIFTHLLDACRRGASSYDLIGGLFRQMNDKNPARAGRYAGVDYFNGGLFATVDPIELTPPELGQLFAAANENNWGYVQPVIFGTLFEGSLGKEERHALGAHFTYESDIQKIVRPTIVRPWDERIAAAKSAAELQGLLRELREFRVLDPACGSGNFLFVAYRSLRELEQRLLLRLFAQKKGLFQEIGLASGISPRNFFGIDVNDNAVETAKVTLMLARRLAHREAEKFWADHADELPGQDTHSLEFERDLPLDNLDANILCADALFAPWPEADAIIGNPPFLDARRVTMIHGAEYTERVRAAFPDVPGRADFCVHWFRKAHEVLRPGCRAGLVGTQSIRHNYSREGGLDYITKNGGTICEAVSSQPWSGESAVHVSIVNWVKGKLDGPKKIFTQVGNNTSNPWAVQTVESIPANLSARCDVTSAKHLQANRKPKVCLEGQQPGHVGFVLSGDEYRTLREKDPNLDEIVKPLLNGDDFISGDYVRNPSWVIDFGECDVTAAQAHRGAFEHLRAKVLADWQRDAEEEHSKTGKSTGEHQNRMERWWQLKRRRGELLEGIAKLSRYIVCSAVTKRPIFEFISSVIRPSNALKAFLFEDDYSFGILQSGIHWAWFTAKGSALTERFRYTPDTVFDTFPWPQFSDSALHNPQSVLDRVRAVAEAAVALRALRREIMKSNGWSLRDLYRSLETPGANRLRDAQFALDSAVRTAYGMTTTEDPLAFLLRLNQDLANREHVGDSIAPPGLPVSAACDNRLVSADCISPNQ